MQIAPWPSWSLGSSLDCSLFFLCYSARVFGRSSNDAFWSVWEKGRSWEPIFGNSIPHHSDGAPQSVGTVEVCWCVVCKAFVVLGIPGRHRYPERLLQPTMTQPLWTILILHESWFIVRERTSPSSSFSLSFLLRSLVWCVSYVFDIPVPWVCFGNPWFGEMLSLTCAMDVALPPVPTLRPGRAVEWHRSVHEHINIILFVLLEPS